MPKINALSIGRQLQGLRAHCFLNQQTTATVLTSKSVLSRCISMADRTNRTQEDVIHDEKNEEFYIPLKAKDFQGKAYLQYSYIKPDYVDLEHTVVPEQFRGHGIAKVLAETVFDHFVGQGKYIRPTCTYLQKFYNENPLPRYTEKVKWR